MVVHVCKISVWAKDSWELNLAGSECIREQMRNYIGEVILLYVENKIE